MTYREKNILVDLMYSILIFGYYFVKVSQMYREGTINPTNVITLWGTIIVVSIFTMIIATIITQIVFAIIHTIKMREDPTFVEDERDRLIELKGTRNSYWILMFGVFLSMLTLAFNASAITMFNLVFLSSTIASIFGNVSRLYFYQRGF